MHKAHISQVEHGLALGLFVIITIFGCVPLQGMASPSRTTTLAMLGLIRSNDTPVKSTPASTLMFALPHDTATQVVIPQQATITIPSIVWPTPSPLVYGTPLGPIQLNATANVPGTFVYTPSAGTIIKAGTATVTATFIPSDLKSYTSAVARVSFPITRAVPLLVWNAVEGLRQDTPLSPAQLNATASVPGAFAYTPSLGAVLMAGTQRLTVAFTPEDSGDYVSVTKHQLIEVDPATAVEIVNVNPSMTTSELQSSLLAAPLNAIILFAPGVYSITSPLYVPCNNLRIKGPSVSPPSAILSGTFQSDFIFKYGAGCSMLGSASNIHFANTGAVYFGIGDNSNFVFQHNMVTNLPADSDELKSEAALYFDGTLQSTLSNIAIRFNIFGDPMSCTYEFVVNYDSGGNCAGIITRQGTLDHIDIQYNNFNHVAEGIHFNQLAQFQKGAAASVCISCSIDYNYIFNWRRIAVEIQVDTPVDPVRVEHNVLADPVNSSTGTMGFSMACCQYTDIFGQLGVSPGLILNDNVTIATLPLESGGCPPYAVEFWGTGAQATSNLIQGTFCYGFQWGEGAGNWSINDNVICGPNFASQGGFINNEEGRPNPPSQTGNITGNSCSVTVSTTPTITLSNATVAGSIVTMTDSSANTGIWYTTDGSFPVPGFGTSRYYVRPIVAPNGTTVNAVGMWGAQNQPFSYPVGYGYVPSAKATVIVTVSSTDTR